MCDMQLHNQSIQIGHNKTLLTVNAHGECFMPFKGRECDNA